MESQLLMPESRLATFQNILLTFQKYQDGNFELLYASSEIKNLLQDGDKFYKQSFFERLMPSLPRPFFQYVFELLGNGDRAICPLVWKDRFFRMVQIEGYVIAQDNLSYLVNVLISPVAFASQTKVAWLMDKANDRVFIGMSQEKEFESITAWKSYFENRFDFLDTKELEDFFSNKQKVVCIFPNHLYLTQTTISPIHCLVQLEYGKDPRTSASVDSIFHEQKVHDKGPVYYEYDLNLQKVSFSGNFSEILGYAVEQSGTIQFEDFLNLVHPADKRIFQDGFQHAGKRHFRMLHAGGHYVDILDEANHEVRESISDGLQMGILTDITALKQIEKDLLEHQTVLDQLMGVVPGMVYMLKAFPDGSREFVYVSEGSKSLWELDPSHILESEHVIRQHIHPDDYQSVLKADREAYEKNKKFECYFRIITPSGKTKWLYGASNRVKQYPNESIWAGIFVDFTYTKEKELESLLNLKRYKSLFEENPLPVFQYDNRGVILDVNKKFTEKVNVKDPSMMVGKNLFDLVGNHPIAKAYRSSIDDGYGFYEGPYVSYFSKTLFHLRVNAKTVEEGKVFQAILEDISEEQFLSNILSELTEKTSRYSGQEFLDTLTAYLSEKLQMSGCFIAEVNEKTEIANVISHYSHGAPQKMFVYNLKGSPCHECLSSNNPHIVQSDAYLKFPEDKGLVDKKISCYMGVPISDNDKNKLGILVLMDENPKPYNEGFYSLLNVLASRIGAELNRMYFEKMLVNSEMLFRSIAENFPKGILEILDKELCYVFTDGTGYEHMNLDPKTLVGKQHLEIYDGKTKVKVQEKLEKVLKGESVIFEVLVDNQYYTKHGVPLFNNDGTVDRILLVTQNISESKIAEAERDRLIKDLKSQNEELQRFAYIISHNIRAPIVNISSLLDLYNSEAPSDPENVEVIENLRVSTDILHTTLEDLIEVVSIKKNKILKIENVSFKKLVRNIERSLSKQLQESETVIHMDFQQAPSINYIYSHLENFIINLTTNAIKYKHPDRAPVIHIRTYHKADYTVIEFKDNGIGIDLDRYRDRLFGLYQRFHSHVDGKGLGLYLVREQIRAHDGNLAVSSVVGEGTSFYIYLKNLIPASSQDNVVE